jgi:hypothetical protein
MWNSLRRTMVLGAAAVLVLGVLATASQAGPPIRTINRGGLVVLPNSATMINPAYRIPVGNNFVPINQYAYNVRVLGNAYSTIPPYLYGYNPYPSPVVVTPWYYSAYSPYMSSLYYNPYAYYGYLYP